MRSDIYVVMKPGAQRCFRESLAASNVMKVRYSVSGGEGLQCSMSAKGSKSTPLPDKILVVEADGEESAIAFQTSEDGWHDICLQCARIRSNVSAKWTLHFDRVGEWSMLGYDEGQVKKSHVKGTEDLLRNSLALSEGVFKDVEFEGREEDELRDASEKTMNYILYYSLAQIFIILCTYVLASRSLAKFIRVSQVY